MLIQPLETLQINNKSNDRNDLKNEFKLEAMKSISNLTSTSITDILLSESSSIQSCLSKFTSKEVLSDKLHCEKCSKKNSTKTYTRSMKQYLICELPAILTIHLKRFQQHGMRLEKLNKNVNFPLILDMSPYTSTQAVNKSSHKILYSLYGVVEHSGKLNSGHYVAFVKAGQQTGKNNGRKFLGQHRLCHLNKMLQFYLNNSSSEEKDVKNETINDINDHSNDKWFYVSDSQVNEVTVSRVLKCQAYILFYERIQ
jgi:ubiquitin carboxyl-terminal hydrolase 16/45